MGLGLSQIRGGPEKTHPVSQFQVLDIDHYENIGVKH